MNPSLAPDAARRRLLRFVTSAVAVIVAACYVGCPSTSVSAQKDLWQGVYVYEASGDKTRGGSAILVDYTLTVRSSGETPSAILELEGFQTDETIYCDTSEAPGMLDVRFKSYANGEIANKYGVKVYQPGEVLFVLERPPTGGLLTDWKALTLSDLKPRKPGRYFRKVEESRPNVHPPSRS